MAVLLRLGGNCLSCEDRRRGWTRVEKYGRSRTGGAEASTAIRVNLRAGVESCPVLFNLFCSRSESMSNQAQDLAAWSEIAASAYRAYAASTGNRNFRGESMPAFSDLPEPIRIAWEAAVRQVGDIFENPKMAFQNEQSWAGYTPPQV